MTVIGLRVSHPDRCHHCDHRGDCWWCIANGFWRLCAVCFTHITGREPTP